jgi:hypothetical protein
VIMVLCAGRQAADTAVPFDPGRDAWHAPAQCVHAAGYVAALIACVLACGWPGPKIWRRRGIGSRPGTGGLALLMSPVTCGPAGPGGS